MIISKKIDGYLLGSFEVCGGKENCDGWVEQGNELSEEAIKIEKEL